LMSEVHLYCNIQKTLALFDSDSSEFTTLFKNIS